jgi:TetR/AcrR family transcriptional regulator, transcriptional repressor of bet genes
MPRRVDHDQRRREIIEALWRITVRGGLGAASFRQVAAEAGISVSLVQYYFGTKADLLHAANRAIGDDMGARIRRRVTKLGVDADPRQLVHAVVNEFLPSDRQSREAMLLFYAFYTAQMTDPALARSETRRAPDGLIAFVASQIRRAQASGDARDDLDPELEAAILTAALPGLASNAIVNFYAGDDVTRAADYAVDRIFSAPPKRTRPRANNPKAPSKRAAR